MKTHPLDHRLTKARTQLIMRFPFFGTLSMYLNMRVADSHPHPLANVAVVDGVTVTFITKWLEDASDSDVLFVMAHEVMHCVLNHLHRRMNKDADAMLWNVAGDYVINYMLVESGLKMPEMGLYDEKYAEMSTDEVYKLLSEKSSRPPNSPMLGDLMEPGSNGENGEGEGTPMTAEQIEADAKEWTTRMVQAAQSADQAGKLPGHIQRVVDKLIKTKTPWQEILQEFMRIETPGNQSWSRPHRNHIGNGIHLPSFVPEKSGYLCFGVDTSGSIDEHMLQQFANEVYSAQTAMRPQSIHVVYIDTQVNHVDVFDRYDPVTMSMHGGGGTEFDPLFQYADTQDEVEFDCMVYLTDGYGSVSASSEPDCPVLWALTVDNPEFNPPFGEVMHIDFDD